ncbi:MAG: hypothetical protein ACXVCP_04180 [Bdellovibrio sp.]
MLLKYTLTMVLFLFIAGCTVEENKPLAGPNKVEEKPNPSPAVDSSTTKKLKPFKASEVEYQVIPLEEPNMYAIDVSWPETDYVVFSRRETEKDFVPVEKSKSSLRYIVKGGTQTRIEMEARETEAANLYAQLALDVSVPTDWIVTDKFVLTDDFKINCGRLFLKKNAVIQINNFDLDIQCDEFISDQATILTFPSGLKSVQKGRAGRSGGVAKLNFKKAKGTLSLYLNGEAGADGRNGYGGGSKSEIVQAINGNYVTKTTAVPGCRGQNGGNGGATGSAQIEIKDLSQLIVLPHFAPGLGGQPGQMIAKEGDNEAINDVPQGHPLFYQTCIKDGGTGNPGLKGGIGDACVKNGNTEKSCQSL